MIKNFPFLLTLLALSGCQALGYDFQNADEFVEAFEERIAELDIEQALKDRLRERLEKEAKAGVIEDVYDLEERLRARLAEALE